MRAQCTARSNPLTLKTTNSKIQKTQARMRKITAAAGVYQVSLQEQQQRNAAKPCVCTTSHRTTAVEGR